MADKEHLRDAGRRLAQDLREVRTARGIDIKILLEATRLPRDIMEMFDENALVDHPAFNRVYLRSIVGSYAGVIGIEKSEALSALEETLSGSYDGSLGRKYLQTEDKASPDAGTPADDDTEDDVEDVSREVVEDPAREENSGDEPETEDSEYVPETDETTQEIRDSADEDDVPTPAVGLPAHMPPVGSWNQSNGTKAVLLPRRFGWLVIAAVAILAALIAWFIWMFGGSGEPEPLPPVTTPVETVEVVREPDWIILGDTMHFEVIAVEDVLNPIRITRDRVPRYPAYIELGDTVHFFVADSVVFERRFILNRADILLEGHLLSDSLIGTDDRLVLTRQRAQRWLDSLAVQLVRR